MADPPSPLPIRLPRSPTGAKRFASLPRVGDTAAGSEPAASASAVDACPGVAGLGEATRAALASALDRLGYAVPEGCDLEHMPLPGIGDAGVRRVLRQAVETTLRRPGDTLGAATCRLGELAPGCASLPDGHISQGACSSRLVAALNRAGCERWSQLLERTPAEVLAWNDVGPTMLAELVGMCIERSLAGLASRPISTASGVGLVLAHERLASDQPLLQALLATLAGDPPLAVREAAGEALRAHAPWALDLDSQLAGVVEALTDGRDRDVFVGWSLRRDARPTLADLGTELGISSTRVGQIRDRAERVARSALAASPPPLPWAVADIRRRLGAVTSEQAAADLLARLGVDTGAAVALWLAGPYEPLANRDGWLATGGPSALALTAASIEADGGVRRLADIAADLGELEVGPGQLVGWLAASGALVLDGDLVVALSGAVVDVVERLLDAYGHELTTDELAACTARGGRDVGAAAVAAAVRNRRFRRIEDRVGLADWPHPTVAATGTPARRRSPSDDPPTPPTPPTPLELARVDGRLWLWVRVDQDVLRGAEGGIPLALVEGLAMQPHRRRTFASRYGPVTLAHDGLFPMRGSVRAIALAAGASVGDTILLGFSSRGDVAVDVRRPPADTSNPAGPPAVLATVGQGGP